MEGKKQILARFDAELQRLKQRYTNKVALKFFERAALSQRRALDAHLETHLNLPENMFQLVVSGVAGKGIDNLDHHLRVDVANRLRLRADAISDPSIERPVSEFLERLDALTENEMLRLPAASISTVLSAYLIRSIYQTQTSDWSAVAAELLRAKGFSDSQINILRKDDILRRAVLLLNATAP